ncbi:MAG: HDIG domain-containing protein [Candidatus Omnitrophica bacterium]|nr:HDIG domain-containing protein [Candidatus Omnitrophota bacterium]
MRNILNPRSDRGIGFNIASRFFAFAAAFVAIVLIISFDRGRHIWKKDFKVGEPAPCSVYSPFDFSVLNESKTKLAKETAAAAVLDVYNIDQAVNQSVFQALDDVFAIVKERQKLPPEKRMEGGTPPVISEANFRIFLETDAEGAKQLLRSASDPVLAEGVIDSAQKSALLSDSKNKILVVKPGDKVETELSVKDLVTADKVSAAIEKRLGEAVKERKLRAALVELAAAAMKPNLVFLGDETARRKKAAETAVATLYDKIQKNELILERGRIVTGKEFSLLEEIENKVIATQTRNKLFGVGLICLIAFSVLASYLYYFERELYGSLRIILLINVVLVATVFLEKVAVSLPHLNAYFMPASLAALLLSVLIRPRLGVLGAFMISIFSGLLTNFKGDIFFFILLGSLTGTYATIGLRKRSQFLEVGALIGIVNFSCIFSYNLLMGSSANTSLQIAVLGLVNGLLISMPLFFIALPVFEHVFGMTTDVTLLELSDLNHPLLRRLVIEAPGTYHHSLVVANLAEAACEAIGADALLARVGCYFHDIGKIEKAEYFAENQNMREGSRHEKLSPSMSCLIITSHVKDGIELARKYKLKGIIIDFIAEHHGTSTVYYFYKKALDEQRPEDEEVRVDDFRYTGPRPRRKETAVTLLADSVEAASRTLQDPAPASLGGLVKKVINDKFIDGQLDECDLTIQDLKKIEESFTRSLMGVFHTRIEYPANDKS